MTEQLNKVTGQVEKLRDIAKTTGERARRQIEGMQEKSQRTIQEVEERAKGGATRVAEETRAVVRNVQAQLAKPNLEALLSRISAKELLEKMHADELVEYGVTVRNELYEKLGVVPAEDFAAAIERLEALETQVKALARKPAAKKPAARKTAAKKPAAKADSANK